MYLPRISRAGAFEGATKIKSTPIPISLEHCCAGHPWVSKSVRSKPLTYLLAACYLTCYSLATYLLTTVLANLFVYSAPIALASDFISQNESAGIRPPINHPPIHSPRIHLPPPVHPPSPLT